MFIAYYRDKKVVGVFCALFDANFIGGNGLMGIPLFRLE
jgi:hypothetical protein